MGRNRQSNRQGKRSWVIASRLMREGFGGEKRDGPPFYLASSPLRCWSGASSSPPSPLPSPPSSVTPFEKATRTGKKTAGPFSVKSLFRSGPVQRKRLAYGSLPGRTRGHICDCDVFHRRSGFTPHQFLLGRFRGMGSFLGQPFSVMSPSMLLLVFCT